MQSFDKLRPLWFTHEKIFDHFISTFDSRVDYYAFHDSGRGSIESHFLNEKQVKKISQLGGSDAASFLNLLNWLEVQDFDDDDIIYIVEDDYLHKKNWIDVLLEGFKYVPAQYFTLYDHPDKYELKMYQDLESKLWTSPSCHWRKTPSTTNTYAVKFKTIIDDIIVHKKWCDLEAKWTKDHFKFIELGEMGRTLASPIPGFSTHCDEDYLSPVVDWSKL